MRRFFGTLLLALLVPTHAWEASVSKTITITITTWVVSLNPPSLAFASQNIGSSSRAQSITLTNTGRVPFPISNVGIIGPDASDFSEMNNCPSSLAVSENCSILVTFTPVVVGTLTASVAVNAIGGGTYAVPLTGTGASLPLTGR